MGSIRITFCYKIKFNVVFCVTAFNEESESIHIKVTLTILLNRALKFCRNISEVLLCTKYSNHS